jgi:hypothetical protein
MTYDEFYRRFGGSLRTKNLTKGVTLPKRSELPAEFIRLDPNEAETLWNVASRARRGVIEVGRFNGGSTFLLACATPDVPVWSIDIAPQDDARLQSLFDQCAVGANVELIVGDSQHGSFPSVGAADAIFIDGDHSYEGCLADIENWLPHLHQPGYLIFHDSYRGDWGVQDAIAETLERNSDLSVVISPFIRADHWNVPTGSMACLVRR